MSENVQDDGKRKIENKQDVSEEAVKALRLYRKINRAVENGKNVEVKKDKDGNLKLLQVSKELI